MLSPFLERQGEVPIISRPVHGGDGRDHLPAGSPRRWPDTAFIMLTGVAEVTTAVECLQHGALDYLSKPVLHRGGPGPGRQCARETPRSSLENRFLQQSYQERLEARFRELDRRNKEHVPAARSRWLVRMLEKKDVYTSGHSQRVAAYAVKTAVHARLYRRGARPDPTGRRAARHRQDRHPRGVLNKPGPLTPASSKQSRSTPPSGRRSWSPSRRASHGTPASSAPITSGWTGPAFPTVSAATGHPDGGPSGLGGGRLRCDDHEPRLPAPSAPGEAFEELARLRGHPLRSRRW